MSNIIHVKPTAPGEITYDPETKTATHVESGLAVQFLRWHTPEPRETEAIFRLTWQGQSYEFKASLDGGGWRESCANFPISLRKSSGKSQMSGITPYYLHIILVLILGSQLQESQNLLITS
jgi:hypothetical protein